MSLTSPPEVRGAQNFRLPVQDDIRQRVGHAQHREMAGIELVPACAEGLCGASLVCLARPVRLTAKYDRRVPRLIPEFLKHHGLVEGRNRVNAGPVGRPFGEVGVEIEKKP